MKRTVFNDPMNEKLWNDTFVYFEIREINIWLRGKIVNQNLFDPWMKRVEKGGKKYPFIKERRWGARSKKGEEKKSIYAIYTQSQYVIIFYLN